MDALRNQGLKSAVYGFLAVAMGVAVVVGFRPGGNAGGAKVKVDCVAEVRGECISPRDYRATLALVAPRMEDAQLKQMQLRRRVVDGLVERALLVQDADRLGVTLSDDDLNAELTSGHALVSLGVETPPMISQYYLHLPPDRPMQLLDVKVNGQFDKKQYEKALRLYVGRGQAEFREMQRAEQIAARMRDLVRARVRLSETEELEAYERDRTKLSFRYVKLDRSWVARFVVPHTEAALDAFIAQHQAQIDSTWESRKKQYLPECRRARHILAKAGVTATDEEKTAARKKIEAAIERVKKGEAFADVARELSEDSSAPEGGALGCVARGKMVKPFEEAAFALAKPGELSPIVETEYGFHVIALDGIYKDAEAEAQGKRDVARELMMNIEGEARTVELGKKILEAARGGLTLDQAVAKVVPTVLPAAPAVVEAPKDKKDDKKKDDKPAAKKPEDPMADPDAPRVEKATDLTAESTNPLPGSEALGIVASLKNPNDVPGDLVKTEAGYAVVQLVERKAPSRTEFDADREKYSRALLGAKQQDALIAYVARLREAAKNDIKLNQNYLADKTPASEESPE